MKVLYEQYMQLEFDFVKDCISFKNRKDFIDWAIEHVEPQIGWSSPPEHIDEQLEWDSFKDVIHNVADHLKIGIGFKWKF